MSHPKENKRKLHNPFDGMLIDDSKILSELEGRQPCPKCNKSRKYYCYSCYIPIPKLEGCLPTVKIPIKIDIIKHKREIDGKSTSGHAAILASQDVRIYTYPDIPDYKKEKAVLVFPGNNAISIMDLLKVKDYSELLEFKGVPRKILPKGYNTSTLLKEKTYTTDFGNRLYNEKFPVDKVVFIDSTWNQSRSIFKDPNVNCIPCVVIKNRISQFWRYQKDSPRWYLATIEAIHQFLVEIHLHKWGLDKNYIGASCCFNEINNKNFEDFYCYSEKAYRGQYDNLLFFFRHMYHLIHKHYNHEELHAYINRA
ncbi:hypothetical protein WA026_022113 [Henosepilachna vigintioctopunctata]|uniref:tRNA-uridine aminocarboxypropyltransferase 1 n=1 Tax=Henosepilachna vigintioctopunctata TaxID=420089 RepID=A0AAW1U3V9_9CUCU